MDAKVSEFGKIGDILVLPLFEGTDKAPNNALNGLSRTQRSLVNDALSSDSFSGKVANTSMFGPPIAKWFWLAWGSPQWERMPGWRGQNLGRSFQGSGYKYHSQIHHWMDYFDDVPVR